MKIARCVDTEGRTLWVEPVGSGRGRLYLGDNPYDGLQATAEELDVTEWLAPLQPTAIYGIGLNYRAHATDTGAAVPDHPVMFMKPGTAVTGPGAAIRLPAACEHGPEVDYEAELAVIIGRETKDIGVHEALEHVFAYTCANDVSARRWQKHAGGGQWVRGKSFDTFCPLGPILVTADEIADPGNLGTIIRTADAAGAAGRVGEGVQHEEEALPGDDREARQDGDLVLARAPGNGKLAAVVADVPEVGRVAQSAAAVGAVTGDDHVEEDVLLVEGPVACQR